VYALLTLFLEDSGLLGEDMRILSVGAGHEAVLLWLANRVAKVVATDIYGEGIFSAGEADRTMLGDPASFSPYPYRESHLEVRHMDAKELEFEDGSFDAVFSLSSIEHFGTWADIRRSAREIGRVLRPGGAAFIATECFLGVGPEQVGSGDGRLSAER
jgi:SAM-dependent methyltransferase